MVLVGSVSFGLILCFAMIVSGWTSMVIWSCTVGGLSADDLIIIFGRSHDVGIISFLKNCRNIVFVSSS